jgi:surfeit locus 1 family protein
MVVRLRRLHITGLDAAFLLVSFCVGLLFLRLGVWQLERLAERRARNALVVRRLAEPPRAVAELPRDTAAAHYMIAHFFGRYDFAHELLLAYRSREGSPGVHFITPLRVPGMDTAVLVDRGWVYAPDAETVDSMRWREPADVDATGYIQELPTIGRGSAALPGRASHVRWLDPAAIARATGYPVAPYLMMLSGDSSTRSLRVPARVPPPPLDAGPHLSYAIQWFAFAAIALVGVPAGFVRSRAAAKAS